MASFECDSPGLYSESDSELLLSMKILTQLMRRKRVRSRLRRFLEVISGSVVNFENVNDIVLNSRFLHYTILSNHVYPNKIVKFPTSIQYSPQLYKPGNEHHVKSASALFMTFIFLLLNCNFFGAQQMLSIAFIAGASSSHHLLCSCVF